MKIIKSKRRSVVQVDELEEEAKAEADREEQQPADGDSVDSAKRY
jgi:hypothetical protein